MRKILSLVIALLMISTLMTACSPNEDAYKHKDKSVPTELVPNEVGNGLPEAPTSPPEELDYSPPECPSK